MKKKLLSSILVICMVLSLLPVTAFADESTGEPSHTHDYKELIGTLKAPTCDKTGIGQYKCSCGDTTYLTMPVEHTKPTGTGAVTTVPATCAKDGSESYKCAKCGEPVTTTLPATGKHNYQRDVTAATCTVAPVIAYICTVCGDIDEERGTEPVANAKPLGHNYKVDTKAEGYKAATCVEDGVNVYVCQNENCDEKPDADGHGKTYTATVTAPGSHDWDAGVKVEATCVNGAGTKKTCQRCGETEVTEIQQGEEGYAPATNEHTWVAAETVSMDCKAGKDGREGGQQCSVCKTLGNGTNGGTAPATIQAKHTEETRDDNVKPATCKAAGSKDVITYCSVCGTTIETKNDVVIDQLDHVPELSGTPLKPATCTVAGIGQYKCKTCGEVLGYQAISAGHKMPTDPDAITIVTAPTCQKEGVGTYTCEVCGDEVTGATLPKVAHDFSGTPVYTATINGEKVTLTAAQAAAYTCVDVTKTLTCENEGCTETDVETVKATGTHDEGTTYDESDCTKGTFVYKACKVCGTKLGDDSNTPVPGTVKKEHNWVLDKTNPKYKAATCKDKGLDTFKCGNGNCKQTKEVETDETGHKWNTGEFIEATCEHNAGTLRTCTVPGCGETEEHYFTDDEARAFGAEYLKQDHKYSSKEVELVPSTCTKQGVAAHYTCATCDTLFIKNDTSGEYEPKTAEDLKLPLGSHDVTGVDATPVEDKTGEHAAQPATCEEPGFHWEVKICKTCGQPVESTYDKVTENVGDNGHAYAMIGTPLKQMNCATNTAGIAQFKCSVCGNQSYESIPVVHSYQNADGSIKVDAQYDAEKSEPPTCTEPGMNVYACTNSGCTYVSEPTEVKALGHDFPTAVRPSGKPDCQDCEVTLTCQRTGCDATTKEIVEADGEHEYVSKTTPATCLHGPITGFACSKCNAVDTKRPSTEASGALGHQWVEDPDDEENAAPSCETRGKKVYVCSRANCDGKPDDATNPSRKVESIAATGHKYSDPVAVDANCEHAAGVTEMCTVCGESKFTAFTGALAGEKNEHEYVDVTPVAATCTEAGVISGKRCKFCGQEKDDDPIVPDPKKDHTGTPVRENEVAATCTAKGSYDEVLYCETCKKEVSRVEKELPIKAENHVNLTATRTLKEATCTASGIGAMHCNDCGEDIGYQTIPMKPHTVPASGAETTAATCTDKGSRTYTCSVCSKKQTEELPALGHAFGETPASIDPVCAENRTATYACTRTGCKETKVVSVKTEAEHTYKIKTAEATCTTPEQFGKVCEVCGATDGKMETVHGSVALDHDYDRENPITSNGAYKAATCNDAGTGVYKCKRCDAIITEAIKALDHDYGEGTVVEPTCVDGNTYVVQVCKRAGCKEGDKGHELKTPVIESTNLAPHKLTATAAVAATCTTDGNIAYWTCSVCKKVFSDAKGEDEVTKDAEGKYETVTKAEHKYDDGVDVSATCEKAAYKLYTCTACDADTTGHTKEEPSADTSLAPHVPNEAALTASSEYQAAACGDTVNFTSFTCKNCGKAISSGDSLQVKKEHTYGEPVITQPTCQKEGSRVYTCSKCADSVDGHIKTEKIKQLEHSFPTVTRPTTGAGSALCEDYTKTVTCTTCTGADALKETKDVTIEASAEHDYEESFVGDGAGYDCTKGIYAGQICKNCGDHKKDAEGNELGNYLPNTKYTEHDFVIDEGQDVDCINGGEYNAHCSRCSATDKVTIDANTGHKFADTDKGTVEGATCTDKGKVMKTCTVCGKKAEDETATGALNPAGHEDPLTEVTIPATCETEEATIQYCSKCIEINSTTGEVIKGTADANNYQKTGGEPKPGGEHVWGTARTTKAPTCTEKGTQTAVCSKCNATKITEMDALGHDKKVDTVEATCTTGGYTITTCKRTGCDYHDESEKGAPDPDKHNIAFAEGDEVLKPATCTDTGIGMGSCTNKGCEYKGWAVIPALDHDMGEPITVDADCTTDGSTTRTCQREGCGHTETTTTPALGHNFVAGRRGFTCSRCGAKSDDGVNPSSANELLTLPVEEVPVEEVPVEEVPVEEAPVEETPVEEVPVEETPVEEAPVEETPVEEAPVEETPVEEASVEETPVEEAPVEETPVEEAPVEETPIEEASVEE